MGKGNFYSDLQPIFLEFCREISGVNTQLSLLHRYFLNTYKLVNLNKLLNYSELQFFHL